VPFVVEFLSDRNMNVVVGWMLNGREVKEKGTTNESRSRRKKKYKFSNADSYHAFLFSFMQTHQVITMVN
jgi:hypothetical protein